MKLGIQTGCCVAALIFLVIIAYANSLGGQFVWDDTLLILDNKHIKSFEYIRNIFKEDLFHMSDMPTGYYRPAQVISYMFDYALWGQMSFGYHIANVILNVLNCILVFYLCLAVFNDRNKSLFVAAVFGVHPAFVPIVSYISGRADLLGMFFSLLLIYLVIRYGAYGKGKIVAFLAIPLYGLALVSKEYYVIAPLFIWLYMLFFNIDTERKKFLKNILIVMLFETIFYAVLRDTILNFHQSMGIIAEQPFFVRLAIFPWILKNYIVTLIAPIDLSMEKKLVYSSFFEARFVVSYLFPAVIALVFYYLGKTKRKTELFWLSWFMVGIMPVCNLIFPLKAIWADHWAYMASIGFFAFLISIISGWKAFKDNMAVKKILLFAGMAFVLFIAAITIKENSFWRNEETLYSRILAKNPDSARIIYNQGKVYEEKGELAKALESYNTAINMSLDSKAQYFNARGMLHKTLGNKEKAVSDFEAAVNGAPSVALYRNNLGCIYAEMDRIEDARREWEKTLEIDPQDELASKNLALIGGKR
ncbi:MAG: hypothetical protein KBB52_05585 [Candidatus Omnitrophica bacterium]|nr:hypothetical protein [Candidatus Omnitrophota bacterium]